MKIIQYPLLFIPIYKNYIWGGNRISKIYNRKILSSRCAESWEISSHQDGLSIIENGIYKNHSLNDIIKKYPEEIIGNNRKNDQFPLLIKIIDAKEKLSIQVHPDNYTSKKYGGEPKTELWYMLSDNNSHVLCGLKNQINRDLFIKSIKNNKIEKSLNKIKIKKGESLVIPGGKPHSINEGCLIYEIQQASNTTYRIHDWNRIDNKGLKRELNVKKALEIINWDDNDDPKIDSQIALDNNKFTIINMGETSFFKLEKIIVKKEIKIKSDKSTFHALFILNGSPIIKWNNNKTITIPKGRSVLIPASLENYTIIGKSEVLKTTLP